MMNSQIRPDALSTKKTELLKLLLRKKGIDVSRVRSIPRRTTSGPCPLSFAQQRLWFLDQLEPNGSAYNVPGVVRLKGRLDVGALEQSLSEVVRRHEALRTRFVVVAGTAVQEIVAATAMSLAVVDLSELGEREREEERARLALAEGRQAFDLRTGPLIRARLVRLGEEEHELMLTMHHIISDGWSVGVLVREVTALYEAYARGYARGEEPQLGELELQYGDYAVWQREWLAGDELAEQIGYWREQLSGAPGVLGLAPDRARPAVQSYRGAHYSLQMSSELTSALRELSRGADVTLFMTLLAAFQVLLYRYTGETDVVVGTPIANRNRAELEGLIGFFVNTLVLRTDLSGEPSFRELLERVREVALGAYAHQDLPFEKLVEELQPERNLSRQPLFQVMFNLINHSGAGELPQVGSLTIERPAPLEAPLSKFDLTLYALEQDENIQFNLVYNSDLFEHAAIVEMLEQLKLLLTQIVAGPDETISSFSLLTREAEAVLPNPRAQLGAGSEGTILTRFLKQSHRIPDQLAVSDKRETWSYGELDLRSNQLANYLMASGIQSQDVVAMYGQRSAALVWALLGVLKAGAAFVILDPSYPAARLINCLRVARPQAWLQIESAEVMPDVLEEYLMSVSFRCRLNVPLPARVAVGDLLAQHAMHQPDVTVGADDLAYVAFTSGSTGVPKGILGAHGPLSHFIQWHSATFNLNESDRFSMLSGLSHDPLLRDVLTPLCLGATLCVPDSEQIEMPGHLAQWMMQEQISITHLTPAMGRILTSTTTEISLPALRYAFYGADALTKGDIRKLRRIAPSATCVNFYGATETPQAAGFFITSDHDDQVESVDVSDPEKIPIGRGIDDVQLLVLDSFQKLAGINEVGEIYVRSPYLAKGYIGDDELTRDKFITNPFTKRAGDYLYRTGDLGRYRPNGDVTFVGRRDQQIKIRGYRIELGEIEAALKEHPAVRDIVAITREDLSGEKRLVAYVVAHQEMPTVGELRAFLNEKLPEYMIPTAFVPLAQLPLTPNGKVDRKALPAPDFAGRATEEPYTAPRTPVEEILAGIWVEMLKVERVGIHDNFFELGGHSLLATQVMSRVREAFQVELSLRVLFEKPTVTQLAQAITENQIDRKDAFTNAITRDTRRGNEYVLAKVDQFSEKDLDALLSRVLP